MDKNILAFAVIGFIIGWQVNGWRADQRMLEYQQQVLTQSLDAQQQLADVQQKFHDINSQYTREGRENEEDVNSIYADLSDDIDAGLRNSSSSASGDAVRDTAYAGDTAQDCGSGVDDSGRLAFAQLREEAGRLRKEVLAKTRQCDLLAVRYNEILQIYNEYKLILDQAKHDERSSND